MKENATVTLLLSASFNFNGGKCNITYSAVKGDGTSDKGDCNVRAESYKLVKKTITDRNGEKKEKEVPAFAPDLKPSKNSPADVIPHEKAKDRAHQDSTDRILPSYKRER